MWNLTSRKGREKWGTSNRASINFKIKGDGQECPSHTSVGAAKSPAHREEIKGPSGLREVGHLQVWRVQRKACSSPGFQPGEE